MAFAHSPKIVTDGMVFYYDTGNSKSYAGEPTVNLAANIQTIEGWTGATSTREDAPEYGTGWKKVTFTEINGSNYRVAKFPYLTQADGTARTYSLEFDIGNLTGYKLFIDGTSGYAQTSISGRGRYSFTVGPVSGTKSIAIFVGKSGTHTGINETLYYRDYQVEEKDHATPFTVGTRSATEALKDFTKNTTLDLSNVSFDSNAQMEFDGTDDQIALTSPTLPSSGGSIEVIVSREGSTPNSFVYAKVGDSTNRYYLRQPASDTFDAVRGNPLSSASFGVLDLGTYYHLVMVWDATTIYAYKNGELQNTSTYTNPGTDAVGGQLGNGPGENNAIRLPLTKFYNRALTAEEVQQNFNTIKGRFGI